MNQIMSKITFHKNFEEEKTKFSVLVYDLQVLNGRQSVKYGLYNFYSRESIAICLTNNDFIQARKKEIIDSIEQFIQKNSNVNIQDIIQRLSRFYSCLHNLDPKNKFNFENIDEVWIGLSRIFEALFYSRSHQFQNEKELTLHLSYDQNYISLFCNLLHQIQFIQNEDRRNKFQTEIFKFLVIQCRVRGQYEHTGHQLLAHEISSEELWPIFSLPYRFLTVYLSYIFYKCNGNVLEYKEVIESYQRNQFQEGTFEMVLYKMSKEFSACYLFFKNRHLEPDSVAELFEMVIRGEKSYQRTCFDQSLEYRKPTSCLHDIDISGLQLAVILSKDKKKLLEFIGNGMALNNVLDFNQRMQELSSLDEQRQRNLFLREVMFFELILVINADELSIANVLFNIFGDKAKSFYKRPYQLAIINQFNQQTVYKIPQIKEKLELEINKDCNSFKELMQDICIYDSAEQHFKLKPQFKNFHNVLMFYKNMKRQGEFYSIIRERADKESQFDCIAGNIIDLQEQIQSPQKISLNLSITSDILEIQNLSQIISNRMKNLNIKNPVDHQYMKHYCHLCYILLKRSTDSNFDNIVRDRDLINFIKKSEEDAELKNCIIKLLLLIDEKRIKMKMPAIFPQQNQPANQAQDKKSDQARDAQRRVMEEFQNKQKGFLAKNQEMYNKEAEKQARGDKILCCQICQQQTGELIVIYCYLALDNLCSLYDPGQNPSKDSKESSNIVRRCTLSSCMHSFHGRCFSTQMMTMHKKIPKRVVNPNKQMAEKEMFCSQCKTLSNTALIYLDPIYKKLSFTQRNNQQININNQNQSQKISNSTDFSINNDKEHLKKEYNEQEYFDYLTLYVVEMEDHVKGRQKDISDYIVDFKLRDNSFISHLISAIKSFIEKFFELSILICDEDIQTILIQAYQYQLDLAFSNGISEFLQKNVIFSKAILQNLSLVQCVHDSDFSIYSRAQERLLLHLSKFHSFSYVLTEKLLKNTYSFDDIWRQVAADLYLIYNNDQNKLQQLMRAFGLLYLQYIQIFYGFLLAKQREIAEVTIEKLKELYLQDIEYRLSCQIFSLPYLRLVMSTYITMFEFNEEIINNQLMKKYIDEEEEVQVYESILGKDFIHINFNSIMFSQTSQKFWNMYMADLNNLDNTQKLQPFLEKNPCFKFSFIKLGDNYMQFHRLHFKPCTLCNRYGPKTKLFVCLICGQVMCVVDCNLTYDYPDQGNLNNHSLSFHEGKSIFMSLQNQEIVLIDYPKSTSQKMPIFLDEIGQPIEVARNEHWEKYTINKKKIESFRQILFNRKLPQHLRSLLYSEDPNINCIDLTY